MTSKFLTLEWWMIFIWIIIFAIWAMILIWMELLIPINLAILAFGIFGMIYCAAMEERWFPNGRR